MGSGQARSEGRAEDEAATEHAPVKIAPLENVYSYFMFMMPVEEARSPGRFTWNKGLACSLVLLTLLLQSVLLYAIFNRVVSGDIAWREGIMGRAASLSLLASDGEPCNAGGTLCTYSNGTFSCAPPSVQLTGRWDELDLDGDGIWTREEVDKSREALKCKYAVDPLEVFNVFLNILRQREKLIWLHPALLAGKEMRKEYFTYASGDLIMCGYRNGDMCANLLMNGVFDAPLRDGVAPRVGETIQSALDYCYRLLDSGGTCERLLPSTYAVWKKNSARQCRGAKYTPAVYKHPVTGEVKSMLTVDYQARKDYSRVDKSLLFFVYKAIIIGSFLLAMYAELKDVAVQVAWVALFPSADEFPDGAVRLEGKSEDGEPAACSIRGITRGHRAAVAALTAARAAVLGVLTVVGVTFLQKDTDWINLLLNSVAMVFVAELATSLYAQALGPGLRESCEGTEAMEVPLRAGAWLRGRPGAGELLGLALLVATVVGVMCLHFLLVGHPLSEALACACVGEGQRCSEAQRFSRAFWGDYWGNQVPAALAEAARLEKGAQGMDGAAALARPLQLGGRSHRAGGRRHGRHRALHRQMLDDEH
mmetsp:Transcript_80385/g.239448  ORF Transcript_80385/g.239448 Transcript_80385/m.239448 type:complete len:592 (+) Transcript_80385:1-1776(+)